MKNTIFSLLIILLVSADASAQDKWKLAEKVDGISVYHATTPGNGFKKIRVEYTTQGTVDKMLAILKDVPGYKSWVYNHKTGSVLKAVSPSEYFFYTETAMPWPVTNRDAVVRVHINRDADQKLTVTENSVPNYIPAKPGKVRVPHSFVKWEVSPAGNNLIKIVYHFEANPGGDLPPWVVNLFADKGPVESFKKLTLLLRR